MAVKIRLTRMGKKKQPFYRIVAVDSRVRRDGKYIEKIGYYNPLTEPAQIVIDEEKAFRWLQNGAIPTDTVRSLFSRKGLLLKWNLKKRGLPDAQISEEFKKWEVLQIERQKRQEALAVQAKSKKAAPPSSEEAAAAEVASAEPTVPAAASPGEAGAPAPTDQAS